ncbi:MAG: winged helix-turn-helix domain-containing protein [Candidatus Bathyarchaeia archaeon]
MSFEEDTYNTIFKAMQHPIRRRILRMIGEKPSIYTEIQRDLNIDNGLLNYHLDALSSLITKNGEEKYTLSDFGKATASLIKGVEEPNMVAEKASTPPVVTWLAVILAVALIVSGVGLLELNNRILDLSGRVNTLQNANTRLEETLRDVNATLISTQKTPLVEVSLNQLLTEETSGNVTIRWMWIIDSGDVDNVEIPFSILGTNLRLISQDDVKTLTLKTNGTRLYSLDEVSLTDSTHGTVKFSLFYAFSVNGVPSIYGAQKITYYLERRAGDWAIYGGMVSFEDYFRAIPLFND